MSLYEEHLRALLPLPEGANTIHDCPDCGHRKLSVKKQNGCLFYHCWRASCGIKGVLELGGREQFNTFLDGFTLDDDRLEPYRGKTYMLSVDQNAALEDRFRLRQETVQRNIMRGAAFYLLPVWDRDGRNVGVLQRLPWKGTELVDYSLGEQKSKLWAGTNEGVMQSWYRARDSKRYKPPSDRIVLVEDQISAMRVVQDISGCDAVALLGVNLNAEKVAELQREHKDIVIALDADATRTAFEHARNWGAAFKSFRVVILTKDIKDMTTEELHDTAI